MNLWVSLCFSSRVKTLTYCVIGTVKNSVINCCMHILLRDILFIKLHMPLTLNRQRRFSVALPGTFWTYWRSGSKATSKRGRDAKRDGAATQAATSSTQCGGVHRPETAADRRPVSPGTLTTGKNKDTALCAHCTCRVENNISVGFVQMLKRLTIMSWERIHFCPCLYYIQFNTNILNKFSHDKDLWWVKTTFIMSPWIFVLERLCICRTLFLCHPPPFSSLKPLTLLNQDSPSPNFANSETSSCLVFLFISLTCLSCFPRQVFGRMPSLKQNTSAVPLNSQLIGVFTL